MIDAIMQPWPWWIVGPLLGLMVPLLLLFAGKNFGISGSFRDFAAICTPRSANAASTSPLCARDVLRRLPPSCRSGASSPSAATSMTTMSETAAGGTAPSVSTSSMPVSSIIVASRAAGSSPSSGTYTPPAFQMPSTATTCDVELPTTTPAHRPRRSPRAYR